MDRLHPFARCGVLIFLSVDQLFASDAQFTRGDTGQINQVQRLADLDG